MDQHQIAQYLNAVTDFSSASTLPEALRISSDPSGLETYYAPFDHVNSGAQLVICGITPGLQQANNALMAAVQALNSGKDLPEALRLAKNTGSFAGAMRNNIAKMLDHLKINEVLGITSSQQLFTDRQDLVHYTSALRYPVFKNGRNYSGDKHMIANPYLWGQIKPMLCQEIAALPGAIWIPLGQSVVAVFEKLVDEGQIDADRVLFGLPHASGANAERIKYFLGEKPRNQLSNKVNPITIDQRKTALVEQVDRMAARATC